VTPDPRAELAAYLRELIVVIEGAIHALEDLRMALETIVGSCERLRASLGEADYGTH
jgi:hypothetical protein